MEFRFEDLRFNPHPPPLKGGREFSRGPEEAFYKVEDILSHYILGNITLEHAIRALNYAKNAIIPKMSYSSDVKVELIQIYDKAIMLLKRLRSREKIKEELLKHGEPRRAIRTLEDFLG